ILPEDYWLSSTLPVETVQKWMGMLHEQLTLSFGASIVVMACLSKLLWSLPVSVYVEREYGRCLPKLSRALDEVNKGQTQIYEELTSNIENQKAASMSWLTAIGSTSSDFRIQSRQQKHQQTLKMAQLLQQVKRVYGFNPLAIHAKKQLSIFSHIPIHLTMFIACNTLFSKFEQVQHG
ncbi:hypothetical protein RFI_33431, partial [Reticulomyxa filosa]